MNRVENVLEPDLLDWNAGDLDDIDEDEFIDLLETFLEDDLEDFLEDQIEDPVSAEGNIICADELCLISAD